MIKFHTIAYHCILITNYSNKLIFFLKKIFPYLFGIHSRKELTRRYWFFVNEKLDKYPEYFTKNEAKLKFQSWLDSYYSEPSTSGYLRTLMPCAAIDYLNATLENELKIFEYASHNSSLLFSRHAKQLVSVYSDSKDLIASMGYLSEQLKFEISGDFQVESLPNTEICLHYDCSDNLSVIQRYPTCYFDLVFLKNCDEISFFNSALFKVKLGGRLIIADINPSVLNSVRVKGSKLGFELLEFIGPLHLQECCGHCIILTRKQSRFSLNDIDLKLEKYLDFDNGIYVEAGANDGVKQSNSLYFESCRGWTGVLVEPVPSLYEDCKINRPNSKVVNCALSSPEESNKSSVIRYAGLMSLVIGAMKSEEEELKHVDLGCKLQNIKDSYEVTVTNRTLSDVLTELDISHIDFLSLDLEGGEAKALMGLDLAKHRPTFILVEARYRNDVESQLFPIYEFIDQLSEHDMLYRIKK